MIKFYLTFAILFISCTCIVNAQVGIGTTTPHASAQLEIVSTNKGFLPPRVTLANRPASPATGLLIFQTDGVAGFYYYNGTAWVNFSALTALSANLNTNTQTLSFDGSISGLKMVNEGGMTVYGVRNSSLSTTPDLNFQLDKAGGLVLRGVLGTGTIPASGSGERMMWHPYKGSFRAGGVGIGVDSWDETYNGFYSVAFGFNTKASGNYTTSIGYANSAMSAYGIAMGYTSISHGTCAVAIGYRCTANADYAMAFGQRASAAGFSGTMVMSDASNTDSLRASAINQFNARYANGYRLYTNATKTVGVSLAAGGNSWAAISDSTKKENFIKPNQEYFLSKLSQLRIGSWNYKVQDKSERHYGPMAQEIFSAFGKDEFGKIGNDTTLASADMDGIMMIMLQGLEKRSTEQQVLNKQLTEEIAAIKTENSSLQQQLAKAIDVKKNQDAIQSQNAVIDQQSKKITELTAEAVELRKLKERLDSLEKLLTSTAK
ncbi:tail fiber domain-containing protein [Pedobacter sp. R-06]|uniref:tail fiber domain-containing protein n=1 Tax=Pedobacter sp. R-06 TaxID=3404051 RepID=UPI003CEAFF3A